MGNIAVFTFAVLEFQTDFYQKDGLRVAKATLFCSFHGSFEFVFSLYLTKYKALYDCKCF